MEGRKNVANTSEVVLGTHQSCPQMSEKIGLRGRLRATFQWSPKKLLVFTSCIGTKFLHTNFFLAFFWLDVLCCFSLVACFSVSCLVSMDQIGSSRTQFSAPWSKVQWFWPGFPCVFWLDWAWTAQFSGMQYLMHSPFSLDLETHWPSSQFSHWKLSSEPNSYVIIF